jgi:serine/threonine protein kinase
MNKLNHPNLVNLFGFKETIDYVKKDGKVNKVMAILMEYAGAGELFEYVANTGRFSEEVSRSYFK